MRRMLMQLVTVIGVIGLVFTQSEIRADTTAGDPLGKQFEGKTLRILHGSAPGGGYDIIARALAIVLPEHLPGRPGRIIVEPRPGGGPFRLNSLRSLVRAKPDGLTIGYAYSAWIVAEAIGDGHPEFKLGDLKPLGTPMGALTDQIYCANAKVANSWEDIEKLGRPITWGGIAPGVTGVLIAAPWLSEIGAPIRVIWGYGGSAETNAAFRRGEFELIASCTGNLYRDYPDWTKQGNVAPIFWFGKASVADDERLKKMGLSRPPHIFEIAKKYVKTDWQMEAFEVGMQLGRLSRAFFVPAGVSEELYVAWRETFRKVVQDPRFTAALHVTYRDEVSPMYGEEVERLLAPMKRLNPEALKLLKVLARGR